MQAEYDDMNRQAWDKVPTDWKIDDVESNMSRIDDIHNLMNNTSLFDMILNLLCSTRFREDTKRKRKFDEEEEEEDEHHSKFEKMDRTIEEKKKIVMIIIEIIANERWYGRSPLSPTLNSLTYLGSNGMKKF